MLQVVALLEAEIAHLRAQLRAGPDEKDRQLINLRRRVLVLGAQLNKSAQSRRTLELGLGRLQELVNVRQSGACTDDSLMGLLPHFALHF